MASSSIIFAFMATLLFSSTMGHSQMRCAKYDPTTRSCAAPIRNSELSFTSEAYDMVTGSTGVCQAAISNPISNSYSNGADCPSWAPCPAPMGTYTPGETFNVMWFARNHATPDQTPGNISIYLSPPRTSGQPDATIEQFRQNHFCEAPFSSCNGQNGNLVECMTQCTMPTNTAAGIYTIWWKWAWQGHTTIYSTCADIVVTSSGSQVPATPSPTVQPSPSPAPVQVPTTPVVPVTPISTPVVQSSSTTTGTTGRASPTTPSSTTTTTGDAAPSTKPASSSCSGNAMKCVSDTTYSMCDRGVWAAAQSCQPNMMCAASIGNSIYCVAPSTAVPISSPISTPVVAPTPAPVPAVPTPVPSVPSTSTSSTSSPSTTPSSGSCTLGYQQCVGSDKYQTCGNGSKGPAWASAQSCQKGLSCRPSGNNIYCV